MLLVTIDTLRADHLSAYGYERKTSPNLDRLAAEGALFEVAYAPVPTTAPSHATLLTGRYPLGHGVLRNGIPLGAEPPTLPELLAARGYRTAAFVSSFPVSAEFGFARGFAHFDDRFEEGRGSMKRREWNQRTVESAFDRLGADTVDRAIAWWSEQDDAAPRFVWVHLFDPHAPYRAPEPYGSAFSDPARRGRHDRRMDAYDGEILYADAQLGRLVDAFARAAGSRGLFTIVTADHGEAFGEHGMFGHNHTVFEEEVRVPLVLHWRGVLAPGVRVASAAHLVDVLPTVAAATGLDLARSRGVLAGIDLLAVVADGAGDEQRAVFLQRPFFEDRKRARRRGMLGFGFGVRRGDWKYIEALEQGQRKLFDLASDPGERTDLAAREAERVSELSAAIASWREHETANAVAVQPPPLRSKEVRRKLRALGYVE